MLAFGKQPASGVPGATVGSRKQPQRQISEGGKETKKAGRRAACPGPLQGLAAPSRMPFQSTVANRPLYECTGKGLFLELSA